MTGSTHIDSCLPFKIFLKFDIDYDIIMIMLFYENQNIKISLKFNIDYDIIIIMLFYENKKYFTREN